MTQNITENPEPRDITGATSTTTTTTTTTTTAATTTTTVFFSVPFLLRSTNFIT